MSPDELELLFCEQFVWNHGLTLYPVQETALGHIARGKSVLVTVPTGTGKTLMAKAALFAAVQKKQRAVYTTPLRALTEEKYRELCADFGEHNVGFATGDFKENRDAPIQVEVAEILWNRVYGDKSQYPADVVVMDEGHYFNDPERGYVWEQTIIGLDPRVQLVVLSATVGHPDRFCHWVELTRRVPMELVQGHERRVPLVHEFREESMIDVVRELAFRGDVPAILFVFGREQCFEVARLLKSCRRFTSDEERTEIMRRCDEVLLGDGAARELRPLLEHGIGVHHAGILPRYKQLVEELTLARLLRFVVSTETISAGINLPAKTVVFPALRKFISGQARLVTPAEYHQMAGRAGRPQFDARGLAITLAPEEVVTELRRELKEAAKRPAYDESKLRKSLYARMRADAQKRGDVLWTPEMHQALVDGAPAELLSKTKITAEQVLAIGLPDLAAVPLQPPDATVAARNEVERGLPASLNLNIHTVIEHLLTDDKTRRALHRTLAQLVDNLRALGVLDEHGRQIAGQMIRELQGMDGPFVYYCVFNHQLEYIELRELAEFLVDHDIIPKLLGKKDEEKRRAWCREKLRDLRLENPQAAWEDAEAAYEREFPRPVTRMQQLHQEFCGRVPHPELHGGKKNKSVWAQIEDEQLGFLQFVLREGLAHEEGNLFGYLVRVQNVARKIGDVTGLSELSDMADRIALLLSGVDVRAV